MTPNGRAVPVPPKRDGDMLPHSAIGCHPCVTSEPPQYWSWQYWSTGNGPALALHVVDAHVDTASGTAVCVTHSPVAVLYS